VRLFKSGRSVKQICQETKISRQHVDSILKRQGYEVKGNHRVDITDCDVVKLYRSGLSIQEIANRYNTKYETIRRRLINNGVKIRGRNSSNSVDKEMVEQLYSMIYQ